jgi:hypothetical protein
MLALLSKIVFHALEKLLNWYLVSGGGITECLLEWNVYIRLSANNS